MKILISEQTVIYDRNRDKQYLMIQNNINTKMKHAIVIEDGEMIMKQTFNTKLNGKTRQQIFDENFDIICSL